MALIQLKRELYSYSTLFVWGSTRSYTESSISQADTVSTESLLQNKIKYDDDEDVYQFQKAIERQREKYHKWISYFKWILWCWVGPQDSSSSCHHSTVHVKLLQ